MRELLENGCGGCGKRAILAEAKEDTTHDLIKGQPATQSGFSASLRDPIRCVLSVVALAVVDCGPRVSGWAKVTCSRLWRRISRPQRPEGCFPGSLSVPSVLSGLEVLSG